MRQLALTVYVQENQAPRAHGELSGTTTVTLTPGGIVKKDVPLGPVRLTDPEGDQITSARIYDFPSLGSINLNFGSELRVVYQPWISEAELCRAVQDKDVLVDEFTVVVEDVCGAKAKIPATVTITVVKLPPALTVPKDVTVGCHESTHPDDTGWATAKDPCDPNPRITYTDAVSPGPCAQARVITRTWTATDACGNKTSGVQLITVVDTTPPVLTVPADVDLGCNPANTNPGVTGRATATDNCDPSPTVTYSDSLTIQGCLFTIRRTWTARDACGNTSQAVQEIRYTADRTPPVLTVPGAVTVECTESTHPDHTGWATATDNCDPNPRVTYTDTVSPGPCAQARTITRTWTATDACGNSTSGVQTIRVVDTTPPVLTVPGAVTVECTESTHPDHTGWASATDNCDPNPRITYTDSVTPGPCAQARTITRTWTATDACGNSTRGVQTIRVVDTTPPVLTVPGAVTVECHESTHPDHTGWATATDNCDPNPSITYTDSVSPGPCAQARTITRTWRATDACGNSTSGIQVITVVDTTPPTIVCPGDITHHTHAPPGTWVWVNFPTATATDNCAPLPAVSCTPSGGMFQVGTTTLASITCTALDACGNSTTTDCTFLVTVEFVNRPPVARDDSADCDGIVFIPVLANDYDPDGHPLRIDFVSTPMCGTAYISGNGIIYTTMGWTCGTPPGPGVRDSFTYTITDDHGGFATATVEITITCVICPMVAPPGPTP